MAARKRSKTGLPPGGRETSPGRISIQFPVPQPDGTIQRLSQQKAMPGEPKSYEGIPAAWAGYTKVTEYLARKVEHGVTLLEFWSDWTDPDHWRWGKKRQPQTIKAQESRTRRFVKRWGHLPIAGIAQQHFAIYMDEGGTESSMAGLSALFNDAERANLLNVHPCREMAQEFRVAYKASKSDAKPQSPTQAQIDAMLDRVQAPGYPRSMYGWLLLGVETGMRGGEIDAASFKHLSGGDYAITEQFNHRLGIFTGPKWKSYRTLGLPAHVLSVLAEFRDDDPLYGRMFVTSRGTHWRHESRAYWWTWCGDGGPSLQQLVGGMTIYEATRHFWASRAINVWGLEPYPVSRAYGHKDGGRTLIKHYLTIDDDAANVRIAAARAAYENRNVIDLDEIRRRAA